MPESHSPTGGRRDESLVKVNTELGLQSGVIIICNIYYVEWIQQGVRHTMRNSVLRCNQSSRLGFLPVAGVGRVLVRIW